MDPLSGCAMRTHFADLTDPRIERTKRHALLDILTLALCAVICGADSWVEVERFGRAKASWLGTFLPLPNGIPSHDTFGRVFAALDPAAFEAAFLGWVQALATATAGEVVAIDGKTLRRSHDRTHGQAALHLVSAWASTNHLVLGQIAVAEPTTEGAGIRSLLATLAVDGCVVTIDAIGCQPAIAQHVLDQGADYVLAVKDNQPTLHELITDHFRLVIPAPDDPSVRRHTTIGKDHGRLEVRRCWATDEPAVLDWLDPQPTWPGRRSIACVEGERRIGEVVTRERRCYLSSLCRPIPPGSRRRCGHTGASRTGCIGCSMWPSARTTAGCGAATPLRTSRCCAISPSTCCAANPPPRSGSRPNASWRAGMKPTCARC